MGGARSEIDMSHRGRLKVFIVVAGRNGKAGMPFADLAWYASVQYACRGHAQRHVPNALKPPLVWLQGIDEVNSVTRDDIPFSPGLVIKLIWLQLGFQAQN